MYTKRCENWKLVYFIIHLLTFYSLQRDGYFCNDEGGAHCSHDFMFKGVCGIVKYQSPLGYYQHLPDPTKGGVDPLMEYCPLMSPFSSSKNRDQGNCRNPNNNGYEASLLGEKYGPESGCFRSDFRSVYNFIYLSYFYRNWSYFTV